MLIKKDDLINGLRVIDLVPSRSGIASAEVIRVENRKGTLDLSLASEVLGTVQVKTKGTWPVESPYFIDRQLLIPFINAAKNIKSDKDFEISDENNNLVITHGKRRAQFNKLPTVSGYGKISLDSKGTSVKFTDAQKKLVIHAVSSAATDPSLSNLQCVYLTEKGVVMSSNQVTVFIGRTEKFKHSLPFPLFLLSLISHEAAREIRFVKDQVALLFDNGVIIQTLPQKALKEFPVKAILNRANDADKVKAIFSVQAERLSSVLDRFDIYMSAVRKQDRTIKLIGEQGKQVLTLQATPLHAKLEETVKLEAPMKVDVSCEWPLDMVKPVISYLGGMREIVSVHFDNKSPYYLKNQYVTLAVARKLK